MYLAFKIQLLTISALFSKSNYTYVFIVKNCYSITNFQLKHLKLCNSPYKHLNKMHLLTTIVTQKVN